MLVVFQHFLSGCLSSCRDFLKAEALKAQEKHMCSSPLSCLEITHSGSWETDRGMQYCAHRQDACSLHKLPIKGEQRIHDIAPDNRGILFNGGMTSKKPLIPGYDDRLFIYFFSFVFSKSDD